MHKLALVLSKTKKGNGHQEKKFDLSMRKNFTLGLVEHWNRLPREIVECPSLSEDIQNSPGCIAM